MSVMVMNTRMLNTNAPSEHAHHIRGVIMAVELADVTQPSEFIPLLVVLPRLVLLKNHFPSFFRLWNVLVNRRKVLHIQVLNKKTNSKKKDKKSEGLATQWVA